jgi:hypothetical protein
VADIFGYHALQLGLPQLQGLRSNRMPHRAGWRWRPRSRSGCKSRHCSASEGDRSVAAAAAR